MISRTLPTNDISIDTIENMVIQSVAAQEPPSPDGPPSIENDPSVMPNEPGADDGSSQATIEQEVCYGESSPIPEFICRAGNYYRAIDCDQIVGDNGLCYSAECTIKKDPSTNKEFDPCVNFRRAFLEAMTTEPRCGACLNINHPVYSD